MSTRSSFVTSLPGIRPVSGWMLGAFVGAHTVLLLTVHAPGFARWIAGPLHEATGGWLSHELVATLMMVALLIGGLLLGVGQLRVRDLGIPTGGSGGWKLLNAVLLTYLLWGLAQLLVAGAATVGLTELVPNPAWMQPLRPSLVGTSVLTVLAGAALEEVLYRGFLFVHLLLALRRWGIGGARWQLAGALAGSQLFFGLNHIPVGLDAGFEGAVLVLYIVQVTLVGMVFTVLFMQTNNLFVAIGTHALINAPGLPFEGGIDASFLVLLLVLGLMLVYPLLAQRCLGAAATPAPRFSSSASPSDRSRPDNS